MFLRIPSVFPCRWVSLVYQVTLGANCLSLGALRWAALIVLWPGTRCSYWCFLLPHSLALFLCFSSTKLNGTIILAEMIWCYKKLHDCWILLLLGWADMRKCTWKPMRINHICAFIYFFVVSYTFLLKHTGLHTGVFGRPHNLKLRWKKMHILKHTWKSLYNSVWKKMSCFKINEFVYLHWTSNIKNRCKKHKLYNNIVEWYQKLWDCFLN